MYQRKQKGKLTRHESVSITTKWGELFIQALGDLDYNKRLARGKSYANTGKTQRIDILGRRIVAKVMGTLMYDVTIEFHPFEPDRLETIYALIESNQLFLAEILNGNLPEALVSELTKLSIHLLPKSWKEMKRTCSCPDVGDPCKHMAAVFYLLGSEIDKNPLTLFDIRGVDLKGRFNLNAEAMKLSMPLSLEYSDPPQPEASTSAKEPEKEVDTQEMETQELSLSLDTQEAETQDPGDEATQPAMEDHLPQINPADLPVELKFSLLGFERMTPFILSCLPKKATFTTLDFPAAMEEFYAAAAKTLPTLLATEPLQEDQKLSQLERILSHSEFSVNLPSVTSAPMVAVRNPVFRVKLEQEDFLQRAGFRRTLANEFEINLVALVQWMLAFSSEFGTKSYQYWFYFSRVLFLVVKSQVFVPAVLSLAPDDSKIRVIFKALDASQQLVRQLEAFEPLYSPHSICVGGRPLLAVSATNTLLSVALTDLIQNRLRFMHKQLKPNPPDTSRAIFWGEEYTVKSLHEKSVPQSISRFFGVFNLLQTDFRLKITLRKNPDPNHGDDSMLDILVKDAQPQGRDSAGLPLHLFLLHHPDSKTGVLKLLASLSVYLPSVEELIKSSSVTLKQQDFEKFVMESTGVFAHIGIELQLEKEFQNTLTPRVVLQITSQENMDNLSFKSLLKLRDLLNYNWKIAIGDKLLTPEEFSKLVESGKKVVMFQESLVVLKPEDVQEIMQKISKPPAPLTPLDILKASAAGNSVIFGGGMTNFFQQLTRIQRSPPPEALTAELREYQLHGYQWAYSNLLNGFGVILADDMGLGKTVQAIAVLLKLRETSHISQTTLIVTPTSLLSNWKRELERFAPSLLVETYYGSNRDEGVFEVDESGPSVPRAKRRKTNPPSAHVILTSYHTVRVEVENMKGFKFDCVVIDEAQSIKNHTSKVSQAIRQLRAPFRLALSGTPVENKLSEMWTIFDFVFPSYLGTVKEFNANYAKPIELQRDAEKLVSLRKITAPFLLRRLKTDENVIKDLPSKVIDNKLTALSPVQAALYESVVQDVTEKLESGEKKNRGSLILGLITKLKQICNHPANFHREGEMSIGVSGKTTLLMSILENIVEAREKVLIFTQYTRMAEIVVQLIRRHLLLDSLFFHGGLSLPQRQKLLTEFETNPAAQIMILSLKAGGVGLNLTQANHVVHFDLWWNPAVENQATDRAFRIGQTRNVFVYRFITENSFEEKIDEMITRKKALSNMSVSTGESWITELSNAEIKELFLLRNPEKKRADGGPLPS